MTSKELQEHSGHASTALTSSPGSSSSTSELTPAQQAIQAVLQVDLQLTNIGIQRKLALLETKALDLNTNIFELSQCRPRMCCFDAGSAQPSWTANEVCARCLVLNEVIQTSAVDTFISRVQVGTIMLTTNCRSEAALQGKVPKLMQELLDMIVDLVVARSRFPTYDVATVGKLMHTSGALRQRVVERMGPIELFGELHEGNNLQDHTMRFSRAFEDRIWYVVLSWINADFAGSSFDGGVELKLPSTLLCTIKGLEVIQVLTEVRVNGAVPQKADGASSESSGDTKYKVIGSDAETASDSDNHHYDLVEDNIFEHLDEWDVAFSTETRLDTYLPPRATSAFNRVLHGRINDKNATVVIELCIKFWLAPPGAHRHTHWESHSAVDGPAQFKRYWRFTTTRTA